MTRMLTPTGAAEYLGMTHEELADFVANPWGPRYRGDGRDRRYDTDDLDRWVSEQERKRTELMSRDLLTTVDATAYCRVSASRLEAHRANNTGPKGMPGPGRTMVYRRQDLDAWIASGGNQ